ncbi:mitofusin, partial [Dimargaris verticillata]
IYTVDGNLDAKQSLLRNGVVDIALIDSPGLNRDSLKTTQLFTRQEEIDVIVFVVNSENHFTLSGQEFLQTAGKEKAYIFIVVNKFDNIRNKDRCRRLILEQIRDLSPRTYANAQDLVHFVSVAEVTRPLAGNGTEAAPVAIPPAFSHLEQSLRSFTLEKRFTSKLAPAQRYLMNLLDDIALLSRENLTLAAERIAYINQELKVAVPVYQNLLARRQVAVDRANRYLDASCEMVRQQTIQRLAAQLERFAQCQRSKYQAAHTKALPTSPSSETKALTPDATVSSPTDSASALSLVDAAEVNEHPDDLQTQVPWGGLLYTFQYIADLKRFLITRMEQELESCEMFTEAVVDKVTLQINDLHTDPMPRKPFYIPWDTIEQELTADGEFLDDSMTVASELATTTRGHHHSFVASPAALFDFSLGPSDFFHWSLKLDFSHLVAMTSASLGTLAMVFSRLPIISTGDLVHRAVQVGSTLGWRGMRHLTLVGGVMLGTGLFMFFTADLDRTIRVRVLERLRERIDDVHYVEQQSYILSQAANKAIRPFVWDVQSSFQRLIEHEEHERAKKLEKRYVAEESRDYFKALIQKSVILQQVVAGVTPVDQV